MWLSHIKLNRLFRAASRSPIMSHINEKEIDICQKITSDTHSATIQKIVGITFLKSFFSLYPQKFSEEQKKQIIDDYCTFIDEFMKDHGELLNVPVLISSYLYSDVVSDLQGVYDDSTGMFIPLSMLLSDRKSIPFVDPAILLFKLAEVSNHSTKLDYTALINAFNVEQLQQINIINADADREAHENESRKLAEIGVVGTPPERIPQGVVRSLNPIHDHKIQRSGDATHSLSLSKRSRTMSGLPDTL